MSVEPELAAGMGAQLRRRDAELLAGATPLGWKLGLTVPAVQERLGLAGPVAGFLTSGTRLDSGVTTSLAGFTAPMIEPEVAIHVGQGGAVTALGAAIELVDIDLPFEDVEAILAGNVFHRAVVMGPPRKGASLDDLTARALVNGQPVAEARVTDAMGDPTDVVGFVAGYLEAYGATIQPGEAIIAGSLTPPVPVGPGDEVAVEVGSLGSLSLRFAAG